jgi:type II secretory pathway pseudopilin PulG
MANPRIHAEMTQGFTLIEALITMSVLITAFLGLASLQVVGVQTNYFGNRMLQASSLATDLAENMRVWQYNDSRLTPLITVSSMNDPAIRSWTLGSAGTTPYILQYSDLTPDPNATNPGAQGPSYQGLSTDVDKNGVVDFIRYWNVYNVDIGTTGTPQGKLIQIIVRWKQPGVGYKQVATAAYKRNPANVF